MYPSPFCNLSRRHWMGGGVQVGCGADGTPTGRRVVPAAGCVGWRPAPAEPPPDTEPPASLPGTLGNGPTGQTPPGNPPPDSGALCARPLPSGRRRVATGADGWLTPPTEPPPDTETPRQPPGHFGRWPNWANAAGEPPARFRGTLRSPPALGPAPTAVGAGW